MLLGAKRMRWRLKRYSQKPYWASSFGLCIPTLILNSDKYKYKHKICITRSTLQLFFTFEKSSKESKWIVGQKHFSSYLFLSLLQITSRQLIHMLLYRTGWNWLLGSKRITYLKGSFTCKKIGLFEIQSSLLLFRKGLCTNTDHWISLANFSKMVLVFAMDVFQKSLFISSVRVKFLFFCQKRFKSIFNWMLISPIFEKLRYLGPFFSFASNVSN